MASRGANAGGGCIRPSAIRSVIRRFGLWLVSVALGADYAGVGAAPQVLKIVAQVLGRERR